MSIPKICEKEKRASDEKYFVGLYLSQHPLFSNLPQVVTDLILTRIRTMYVKAGEVVHAGGPPQFMGVIFAGVLVTKPRDGGKGKDGARSKEGVANEKNSVIMASAFNQQPEDPIYCREEAIILALDVGVYRELVERLRGDIEMRERDEVNDLLKSTFFSELHMKDKKSIPFYDSCELKFYFDGQVIAEAGTDVSHFYLIFKGTVIQENHIYIREHNKWPLPYRKWEVRAVYNSYHKQH